MPKKPLHPRKNLKRSISKDRKGIDQIERDVDRTTKDGLILGVVRAVYAMYVTLIMSKIRITPPPLLFFVRKELFIKYQDYPPPLLFF